MNRKALAGIGIAVLIPVISYLILKTVSDDAVTIPPHYLPDSVVSHVDKGKMTTDTVWHTVADIRLVNQLNDTVSLYDIQGKIIVADFIFTSCASVCPSLTKNMAKLQRSFITGGDPIKKPDTSLVQFVSFTIDPERDSVQRLKNYADKFGVDHDNWWFLTGNKDSIYNFIFEQLKVDKYETNGPLDPDFAHTQRFVLIDRSKQVRGYYNGLDSAALGKLAKDIGVLMLEKGKQPAKLPFDPLLMGIFFMITLVVVVIAIRLLFRKKNM